MHRWFFLLVLGLSASAHAGTYVLQCTAPCVASDSTSQPAGTYLQKIEWDGVTPYNPPGFAVLPYTNQTIYQPIDRTDATPATSSGPVINLTASTYGTFANATAMSVMANNPAATPQVVGITAPSQIATYGARDSVALYVSNKDRPPRFTFSGGTYDTLHWYPSTPLTNAQIGAIRKGAWLETNDSPKFTGQISAVSASAITVTGWYQHGNTADGQTPAGSTVYVDVVTTPFGLNIICRYDGYYVNGLGCVGAEIDLNLQAPFTRGDLYTVVGDTPQVFPLSLVSVGSQSPGAALLVTGNFERGVVVRGAKSGGFIYGPNTGTGFLSGQTSGNAFEIRDKASGATLAALTPPSVLNLGMQSGGTPNVPRINFYSTAGASPDATIRVEGGNATANNGIVRMFTGSMQVIGPAADYVSIQPAGVNGAVIQAVTAGNSQLLLKTSGTAPIGMLGNTSGFDARVALFNPVSVSGANQTNYLNFSAALSGSPARMVAAGVDADAGLTVAAAGSGTTTVGSATGAVSLQGTVKAGAVAGVSCAAGTVSLATLVVTNGIVTHC